MRLYLEVARRSFQRYLAYRGATLAGLWANTVFGVLLASVYAALFRSRGGEEVVAGFNLTEMFTFVWIGQSLIMVLYMWGWWEVATAVQTGDVVSDLLKPFDYYGFWLSRDLGRAACHVLTRFLPTFLIGVLLYDLALPALSLTWLAFAVSVVLAVVVSFAYRFMVNLGAFWMTDVRGIGYLTMLAVNFFSGFLVPISFFPPWLRTVAEVLPFRAMAMLPIEILLGHGSTGVALALQAFWAVALSLLARLMLGAATRKLVVQGG